MSPSSRCKEICETVYEILSVVLAAAVALSQGILLNFFLADHYGLVWHCWILVDVVVVVTIGVVYIIPKCRRGNNRHGERARGGDRSHSILNSKLPLVFISWIVYLPGYISRMAIIYSQFVTQLPNTGFSPILLKFTLSLSGALLFLLLISHFWDDLDKINFQAIVFDVLDSVEVLDVLIVQYSRIILPMSLDRAIISLSCLYTAVPIVPLIALSTTESYSKKLLFAHKLIHIFIINLPLLGLRIFFWVQLGHDISVFLMKNFLILYIAAQSLVKFTLVGSSKRPDEHESSIELQNKY